MKHCMRSCSNCRSSWSSGSFIWIRPVFDAAESACQYYTENIRNLSGRQEEICRKMEQETREKCDRMLEQAKQMSRVYWDEYTEKCNRYMKTMENAQRTAEVSEKTEMEIIKCI